MKYFRVGTLVNCVTIFIVHVIFIGAIRNLSIMKPHVIAFIMEYESLQKIHLFIVYNIKNTHFSEKNYNLQMWLSCTKGARYIRTTVGEIV